MLLRKEGARGEEETREGECLNLQEIEILSVKTTL